LQSQGKNLFEYYILNTQYICYYILNTIYWILYICNLKARNLQSQARIDLNTIHRQYIWILYIEGSQDHTLPRAVNTKYKTKAIKTASWLFFVSLLFILKMLFFYQKRGRRRKERQTMLQAYSMVNPVSLIFFLWVLLLPLSLIGQSYFHNRNILCPLF
jgi:hypothetical protein